MMLEKIKTKMRGYEILIMPLVLVVGFGIDYLTFANIQIDTTLAILFLYWVLTGVSLFFMYAYDAGRISASYGLKTLRKLLPIFVQFAFGSLLGSSLIFYWFFGAFAVSWPLLLLIVFLMIFNEKFREALQKPAVQMSVYFFCTISLFSLALPFWLVSLEMILFVYASVGSFLVFVLLVSLLSRFFVWQNEYRNKILFSFFLIMVVMNAFYFGNIIPPIPLALREVGIYRNLEVKNGRYIMQKESSLAWRDMLFGQKITTHFGEKIYAYSAIFAPVNLKTTIVHDWQFYDESRKQWVSRASLVFDIAGGRQEGYKGYSWMSSLEKGDWRIYVKNLRGQVLGVTRFSVDYQDRIEDFQTLIK